MFFDTLSCSPACGVHRGAGVLPVVWDRMARDRRRAAAFRFLAMMTALPLAFIASAVLFPEGHQNPKEEKIAGLRFLPLFVFLPKIIRYAVRADTDAVLEAFGKNEQTRKVFWALFMALAGLVLAEVVGPVTAQAVLAAITGA